jgi:hypothetical protein
MLGPPLNHAGSIKPNQFLVYHVLPTSTCLFPILNKQSILVFSFEYLADNSNVVAVTSIQMHVTRHFIQVYWKLIMHLLN